MTPQQQLNAFLSHCTDIRQGYFYSFKKKSSSLRPLIAMLEKQIRDNSFRALLEEGQQQVITHLQRTSPKDHVKYMSPIKSICAVWGTQRDYVRLNLDNPLPVTTLYWSVVGGTLGTVPTKIGISSRYPGYHYAVAQHLNALTYVGAGQTLLAGLAASPAHNVIIVDHPLTNQCGTNGHTGGMNLVAKELYSEVETKLGAATQAALGRTATGGQTRAAWLANAINQTPVYQLKGIPAVAPCNLGVTEGQVQAWLGGQSIWQDYGNDPALAQIKNAIIIALYPQSTDGPGCNSTVNYSLGTTNPLNAERPPAIGLAHELVHAYYNMQGKQPGFEVDSPTTVLFEYRCVGLGPWANAAVSENAIRTGWANALTHFADDDDRNRRDIGLRAFYSAP